MIYIPHPTFNFEKSQGGYVIGSVFGQISFTEENIFSGLPRPENIESHSLAISSCYWNPRKYRTYSFVREDGKEYAIRLIFNANVDVIGHWSSEVEAEEKTVIITGFGGKVAASYVEFVRWFVASIKS